MKYATKIRRARRFAHEKVAVNWEETNDRRILHIRHFTHEDAVIVFENHFSVFPIRPVSPAGQSWPDENVSVSETLAFGGAVVCEPRYVEAIFRRAIADGLVCQ